MNSENQPEAVGQKAYSSVWESTPHWTYVRRDRYSSGSGLGEYFVPESVRDTFYGRLTSLVNRIKRHLPWF